MTGVPGKGRCGAQAGVSWQMGGESSVVSSQVPYASTSLLGKLAPASLLETQRWGGMGGGGKTWSQTFASRPLTGSTLLLILEG